MAEKKWEGDLSSGMEKNNGRLGPSTLFISTLGNRGYYQNGPSSRGHDLKSIFKWIDRMVLILTTRFRYKDFFQTFARSFLAYVSILMRRAGSTPLTSIRRMGIWRERGCKNQGNTDSTCRHNKSHIKGKGSNIIMSRFTMIRASRKTSYHAIWRGAKHTS